MINMINIRHSLLIRGIRRGRKTTLYKSDKIPLNNQIVIEFPDDITDEERNNREYLASGRFKFKIGNGNDFYRDLPYEIGEIPAIILW